MKVTEVVVTDYFPPKAKLDSEWIDAARKLGFRAGAANYRTLEGWYVVSVNEDFYAVHTKKVSKGTKIWVTPIKKNEIDPARAGGVVAGSTPEASLNNWCKVMKRMKLEVQPLSTEPKDNDAFAVVKIAGNHYELYTKKIGSTFVYARLA